MYKKTFIFYKYLALPIVVYIELGGSYKCAFYIICEKLTNKQPFIDILYVCLFVSLMVFNATFSNISVISCRSVLLVEETGVSEENNRHDASH